jgi:hypothetical protein
MQVSWRHEHRLVGGTGDPKQKSDQVEQQAPGLGRSARAVASVLIVVLAAVAFATLLRPRNGYASTDRLLVVLVLGAASAVGALIIAGAAATLRRRGPDRSLWRAVTSLRSMSFVLALFIAAAVASQVLHAIRPASGTAGASAAARGDFRRWQATAVPIMVQWMAAIRNDNAFVRGLPDTAAGRLRQRVDRSARTLARLSRSLAAAAPRLPQRPNLRRLTQELEQALAAARRAQASYTFALAVANRAGGIRTAQQALIRRLIARGNKDIRRSLATMTGVSLDANKLGASLFVEAP